MGPWGDVPSSNKEPCTCHMPSCLWEEATPRSWLPKPSASGQHKLFLVSAKTGSADPPSLLLFTEIQQNQDESFSYAATPVFRILKYLIRLLIHRYFASIRVYSIFYSHYA